MARELLATAAIPTFRELLKAIDWVVGAHLVLLEMDIMLNMAAAAAVVVVALAVAPYTAPVEEEVYRLLEVPGGLIAMAVVGLAVSGGVVVLEAMGHPEIMEPVMAVAEVVAIPVELEVQAE